MKTRFAILLLSLLLSACATGRFSAMPNIMASCGMPKAPYAKFHACMETKVTVSSHAQEGDYYAKSSRELLAMLNDLQKQVDKHKISNRQAYIQLQNYVQQRILLERQQAQQAAVAFAVLAGAAAVGICSSHGGCGGSGGSGSAGGYNEPLLCSEDPYATRHCNIGKACGNTCIASSDECYLGRGTACNMTPKFYP